MPRTLAEAAVALEAGADRANVLQARVTLHPRLLSGAALRHAWTAALAVIGVLLMTFR